MALPDRFTDSGLLTVGTFEATFPELRESILVLGPPDSSVEDWDSERRANLVDNAEVLVNQLWTIGITEIFLDGSFTEAKPRPNDIDGYFECDPVEFARGNIQSALNALDPHKVWTWDLNSRRRARGTSKAQLPMWHRYRVEFYPHFPGLLSGIRDPSGIELPYPKAFRQQRDTGIRKGIIKVVR